MKQKNQTQVKNNIPINKILLASSLIVILFMVFGFQQSGQAFDTTSLLNMMLPIFFGIGFVVIFMKYTFKNRSENE